MANEPTGITVRTATERDYPAVARLQQISPEAAQWPLGDYSGFHILLALLSAEAGAVPAGFCAWRQAAPDEAELLNLAVDPVCRRMGVASALLENLARHAIGRLFLEVAEPNYPAIALYRHHGWVQVGVRKGYYEQGTVNAIVMEKRT